MIVYIVRSFSNINHLRQSFGFYFSMLALAPILYDVFIPVGTYHIRLTKDNLSISRTWWKLKGLIRVCVFTKLVLAQHCDLFFLSAYRCNLSIVYIFKSLAAPHFIQFFSEQDFLSSQQACLPWKLHLIFRISCQPIC